MDALGHRAVRRGRPRHRALSIGYALAADHPDRVDRVALARGPRASRRASLAAPVPARRRSTTRLWHIPFNRVRRRARTARSRGREDIYFGYEFDIQAGKQAARGRRSTTTSCLVSDPDALRGSFGFYRAFDATIAQNAQRRHPAG